jgi:hemoglobin/transferrin/lactoferrin receptor protein
LFYFEKIQTKIIFMRALVWLLLGFGYLAHAQVVTITDSETGKPAEFATISSQQPKAFAITNVRGRADISAFSGAAIIEIRLMGYETFVLSYEELSAAGFKVALKAASLNLDQVVISATRWNQSTRDVPAKVSAITAKQVELANPQTTADLLGVSGEVFIQKSQQGGGSPMIRGFSTNRLLIAVDGVRMNTAIFRGGNLQNVISLDPFAIESTEIFFGPGSVIYGSDAIGGVMSFQTLTPQLSADEKALATGKAGMRYATANQEQTGHFDFNVAWKRWSVLSSVTHTDYDDLRMGKYGPNSYLKYIYVKRQDGEDVIVDNPDPRVQVPSGYSQLNLMHKVRYKPNDRWDFQLAHHYSTTSDNPRYDRHIRYRPNGDPRSAKWYYGPQVWQMTQLSISHTGTSGFYDQMNIRVAQQYFAESRHDRNLNSSTLRHRTEDVMARSANVDYVKQVSERSKLFYGVEGIWNDVTSGGTDKDITSGESVDGPSRYPQATWASYAVYSTWQYQATEKTLLQAGARYNAFSLYADFRDNLPFYPFPFEEANIQKGALTGSLGLVHNASESLAFSAGVATGFRSPNVDDIGKVFDSAAGTVTVPNTGLQAEYAWNAEVGVAKVFAERVKVDMAAYYTLLKNAMVRRPFTLNGESVIDYEGEPSDVFAIQNAAEARVKGIQLGVEVKLIGGWSLWSQANYQRGTEEQDDGQVSASRHAPPWFGITRLSYTRSKTTLQLYSTYSGGRKFIGLPLEEREKPEIYATDSNGNPWSPAWMTLNFKAMQTVADRYSLTLGVENIADVRYRPYSSGLVAPGRNFIVAVRGRF